MNIRDFEPQDRQQFIDMCTAFYTSGATQCNISQQAMYRTFEATIENSPYLRGLMVEEGEQIIGYAHLSFTYSNEADGLVVFIEELYVIPQHQGQGVGTQVLQWIIKHYGDSVKWYELEVEHDNLGALKLYDRLGFTVNDYVQLKLDVDGVGVNYGR